MHDDRLWAALRFQRRARQHLRLPVPSREESKRGAADHPELRRPLMRPPRMPLAIIVAGMMSGCGGTTNEVITSPQIGQYRIVRIAVLPFTVTPKTLGQGRGYAEPAPPPVAAEKLAELFYLKLNAREGIVVVPPRNVRGAMPALPAAAVSRAQLRARRTGGCGGCPGRDRGGLQGTKGQRDRPGSA